MIETNIESFFHKMPYTYNMDSRPYGNLFDRLGRCGNCELQKFYRWSFLLSSMGNSLILIGLTTAEIISCAKSNKGYLSFAFDFSILFIGVIAGSYAFHGIVFEYKYDIYIHLVSMSMAVVYCWIDYSYAGIDISTIRLVRSIVASSLLLPTLLFSLCVTCSEYWLEFYIIGASEEMLNMYKKLRCFLSLLKFDFLTTVVMGIFSLSHGLLSPLKDGLPVGIISLYALAFLILATNGVRNENPLPLYIFIFSSIGPPVWVTYKFVNDNCLTISCSQLVAALNYTGFAAGILAVVVKMFILIELMKVFKNFGYGLSDRAFSYLISPESTSLLGRPRRGSL